MDLAAWLRNMGLECYEHAFRANDIDVDILPELTAEDLAAIGITSAGHRRQLLAAIAGLRNEAAVGRTAEPHPKPVTAPTAGSSLPTAERRQLTVLFCDLVGSTELAATMDPEDLRAIIGACYVRCAEVVRRFGGRVAKYLGGGVLAYFGYPEAHEDDAERAVRAGLALIEAVAGGPAPRPGVALGARVGIATGLVVAGRLNDGGAARDEVVGEALNLAARLQELAAPSTVVVAAGTRRLVGGRFEYAALGEQRLRGLAARVPAWRVLGLSTAEGRLEAHRGAGLTPLVGRKKELALLLDRWQRAEGGEGQVVLLAGEPGIGKSRLLRALVDRLGGEPHARLRRTCSPFYANSALHPVIDQIERAAGLQRDDTAEAKLDKLEALLAQSAEDVAAAAPLFADLLSIPAEGRYPPLDLTPQRRRERLFETLLAQLEGLAARRPVLTLWEDVHWIDPTSLEFLGLVVDRVQRLPVLTVITFRPDGFRPPWTGRAHVTALSLDRLGRRQAAAMVERVTAGKALPAEVLERIVARTDGVPLYVEELTKAVLESGLLRDAGDRLELSGPLPPLAIPATLQDSLMARLDRLAPVKEVAQVGAALGREFSYELLAAVAPLGEERLRDALGQLCAAELVFCRGAPPEATYRFKHALVRDVAYQSLLKGTRQRLHARIAQVLEERFPDMVETEPELLARHCTEAGLAEKAVGYRYRAGQLALARSAMAEAAAEFAKGLELLGHLPDGPERRRRELDLQLALAGALIAARGYGAPEAGRAFARARELCGQMGEPSRLVPALYGRYVFHLVRAEFAMARQAAEELLGLAEGRDDAAALVMGHRAVGNIALSLGDWAAARAHLERALVLDHPARHRPPGSGYVDPRVGALQHLAWALFGLGHPEQALARSREALTTARERAHPNTTAYALFFGCALRQLIRDPREAGQQADALIALAGARGFPLWSAGGTVVRGWGLAVGGRAEEGLAEIGRGLAGWRATGAEYLIPYFLALAAAAHGRAGRAGEALNLLAGALAQAGRTGERWFEAELHRLTGEALLAPSPDGSVEAESRYHRALAVARAQGARLWELRAATSLARLWRDRGRRGEAHDLLAPIYGGFSEGFDTPDLQDARALVDELR